MHRIAAGAALIILTLTAAPTPATAHPGPTGGPDTLSVLARQIGRQALPTNDGWAAAGPGTTG
ncbi:pectate lyase, partial [Verrucosispora sp. SN26_14.1]